jgi:hypothetical protein
MLLIVTLAALTACSVVVAVDLSQRGSTANEIAAAIGVPVTIEIVLVGGAVAIIRRRRTTRWSRPDALRIGGPDPGGRGSDAPADEPALLRSPKPLVPRSEPPRDRPLILD